MKELAILTLTLAALVSRAAFELAEDGTTTASISLAKDASPPEQLAKRELNAYLRKVVGNGAAAESKRQIVIGTVNNTPQLDTTTKNRLEKAERDAFHIRITDDRILITGKDPRSALFGAYAFIESYLGVKWFYPGELGEYVPQKKTISLAASDEFSQADFKYRTLNVSAGSKDFLSTYEWMTRNGMQHVCRNWQFSHDYRKKFTKVDRDLWKAEHASDPVASAGGHHMTRTAVPRSLMKEHPEYFALKNGERVDEGEKGARRVNRCLSNKGVQDLVAASFIKAYENNPKAVLTFLGEDSMDAFCECDECKQMGTYNGRYTATVYFHRFYKAISDRILKKYPDANICFYAYWNYRAVPEDPALTYRSKNSYVHFSGHQKCAAHRFSPDSPCNKGIYNAVSGWVTRATAVKFGEYHSLNRCRYAPFECLVADDIKTLKTMGVSGWQSEVCTACMPLEEHVGKLGKYNWVSNWQLYYVAAKMMWNTSGDADTLLDEAYDCYYGKAALVMKQYHAYRRVLWDNAPGCSYLNGPVRTAYCMAVPEAGKKLNDYLDEALKLADSGLVKKRIEQDQFFLDLFWKQPAEKLKKALSQKKELVPLKTEDKITIDGKFDEKTWMKAKQIDRFLTLRKKQIPVEKTNVRVAYDNDNIYIAVIADNSKGVTPVLAKTKERDGEDGDIWNDDIMEVRIFPPNEDDKYFHWAVNTMAVFYDAACLGMAFDKQFESQAEIKVVQDGKNYNYEMRIPLASMNAKIEPGKTWKMHFTRTIANLLPPTTHEWSSVDGLTSSDSIYYRNAVFGANYMNNGNFAVIDEQYTINNKTFAFPKFWGTSGKAIDQHKVIKTDAGNQVWFNGVIHSWVNRPNKISIPEGEYVFSVRAKGKGAIQCTTHSYERGKDLKALNHRRLDLGKDTLTDEFKDYIFKCKFLPSEYSFTLFIFGEDITVENVACTIVQDKSNLSLPSMHREREE